MKHLVLLSAALLILGSGIAGAQATYTIDWNYPDTLHAEVGQAVLKRTGTVRNLNDQAKEILFRFNIDKVIEGHSVGFCFGDLCYFQWPGVDDPYERDPQHLPGNGTLPVYSLCNILNKTQGTSVVWYEMFDKNNPNDTLPFTITYIVGEPTSVRDAKELGITVSPIPATDRLTVSSTASTRGADVYSSAGVLLRSYIAQPGATLSLDVQDLATGSYHLVLTQSDGTVVQAPFVIAR